MSLEVASTSAVSPRKLPSDGGLFKGEEWWHNHYTWLERCGYRLRSRYSPDWVPSWKGTGKYWNDCEDGQTIPSGILADAIRISDGAFTGLKWVHKPSHPYETDIGTFFSSEPRASHPDNYCVPIWDVLQVPDDEEVIVLAMPLLRRYYDPRFDTFGECVDFFAQVFQGLQFMHRSHVAHRDCMRLNIMMDATPLYPEPYHPSEPDMRRDWKGKAKHFTRTQRPVKYYFIDFGISRRYDPQDSRPLEDPIWGGDKTVPEFQTSNDPCDPFPTDVYYLGNLIREDFLRGKYGFEFMEPLVIDMVQDDPTKRPNMDEVVARYDTIRSSLSSWKLRSRVVLTSDWSLFGFFRAISHWTRRIGFILRRIPSIPTYSSSA